MVKRTPPKITWFVSKVIASPNLWRIPKRRNAGVESNGREIFVIIELLLRLKES